jgi:DNA-binding IclR family transcriptional regulator
MSRGPIGTVDRVIEILRAVAEAEGELAIKDTARALGLPPSTVHRMFDVFVRRGLLEADRERHRYRAGTELYRLAALIAERMDPGALAGDEMAEIVAASGETCVLARYDASGFRMTYVACAETPHALRIGIELFAKLAIMWGAAGLAILAQLAPLDVEEAIKLSGPSPASGAKPPDRGALFARVAAIREAGHARSHGEDITGAHGIAAPVFGIAGRITGSLAVVIPDARYDAEAADDIAALLIEQAARISKRIGDTLADPQARRFRAWALGR